MVQNRGFFFAEMPSTRKAGPSGINDNVRKKSMKCKQKRRFFQYSEEALQTAINEIQQGTISINKASQNFNIPKTTIIDRLKGRSMGIKRKTGPEPLLTNVVEIKLKEWILNIAKCGFPLKKSDLFDTVEQIAKDLGKSNMGRSGTRIF